MDYKNLNPQADESEVCLACSNEVTIQIFKGSGSCSLLCQKYRNREISRSEWLALKADNK